MNPPLSVRITGWGAYAPETVLTNADLARIVDTSDEWITSRTGIRERRVAAPHETTATMGAIAGKRAVAVAGLQPDDIDLIVVATLTPDHVTPATAVLVKEALGNHRAPAFDIGAACSGFVYGYATAHAYVKSGMARTPSSSAPSCSPGSSISATAAPASCSATAPARSCCPLRTRRGAAWVAWS